jgi:hypothetical protein
MEPCGLPGFKSPSRSQEIIAELTAGLVVLSLIPRRWLPRDRLWTRQALRWNCWVPLFLKFDLLKEFHEVRSGHVSTGEARLFSLKQ